MVCSSRMKSLIGWVRHPDKTKEGIAIAAETVRALRDITRGVLLVAIGGQERLAAVVEQI